MAKLIQTSSENLNSNRTRCQTQIWTRTMWYRCWGDRGLDPIIASWSGSSLVRLLTKPPTFWGKMYLLFANFLIKFKGNNLDPSQLIDKSRSATLEKNPPWMIEDHLPLETNDGNWDCAVSWNYHNHEISKLNGNPKMQLTKTFYSSFSRNTRKRDRQE